jgi:DNA-binding GntR family transcriptional regulator
LRAGFSLGKLAAVPSPPSSKARKKPSPRTRGAATTTPRRVKPDNADYAFQQLRELIVWGQLPPGTPLAERIVAERLGVSRTPVRSALHRLRQEGFVASLRHHGEQRLTVAPMTQEDGRELYLTVGHLEGLAAHLAARLPLSDRQQLVASLRAVNRQLAVVLRERTLVAEVFQLDLEFHRLIVEASVGPRLLALHGTIKPQIERYARAYIGVLLGELNDSLSEHDAIITGILKGDARAAQHAVENNWHNAADRLTRVIAKYGERGSWHAVDLTAIPQVRTHGAERPKRRANV